MVLYALGTRLGRLIQRVRLSPPVLALGTMRRTTHIAVATITITPCKQETATETPTALEQKAERVRQLEWEADEAHKEAQRLNKLGRWVVRFDVEPCSYA